jgi:tetratricopeptide (TPR) repeat protein
MVKILLGLMFCLSLFSGAFAFVQEDDIRLTIARTMATQGESEQAIEQYLSYLSEKPNNGLVWLALALVYEKSGKTKEGKSCRVKAASLAPALESPSKSGLFQEAVNLTANKKNKKAIAAWRKFLKMKPDHAGAYYYAGIVRYNMKEKDKAVYNLKKGLSYKKEGFKANYFLGKIAESRKNNKAAVNYYKAFVKKSPGGEHRTDSEKRLKVLGEDMLKYLHHDLNREGVFSVIENQIPGNLILKRAWNLYKDGQVNKAIILLRGAQLKFPESKVSRLAQVNLISLYSELGLGDLVLELGKYVINSQVGEPYQSRVALLLSQEYLSREDLKNTQKYLKKVNLKSKIHGFPSADNIAKIQARFSQQKGDVSGELGTLEKALEKEDSLEEKQKIHIKIAKILKDSSMKKSRHHFAKSLKLCRHKNELICKEALVGIADLSYKLKDWAIAKDSYSKYLELENDSINSPWSQYQIGNVFREQGVLDEAIRSYDKVAEAWSQNYWAEQAHWKKNDVVWQKQYGYILDEYGK